MTTRDGDGTPPARIYAELCRGRACGDPDCREPVEWAVWHVDDE